MEGSNMTEIKKQEDNKVFFDLTVPAQDINKAEQEVFNKNRQYFNIPGFRKGKAPRKIVENIYGKDMFFEDAINELLPERYNDAIKELDLKVIDQPEVDIEDYTRGEDVVVSFSVLVAPEAKLGKYKGVEIEAVSEEVPEEAIDAELENQRKLNARQINVDDRPAEDGDRVNIDFEGKVDGEVFEGGTGENQDLELGSNTFIPGFEEQIVGHEVGDTFDVKVTFPEDYFADELKGKEAVFEVKLNSISFEELPELNDEFIKDISEFDTIEEYKDDFRKKKEEQYKETAKQTRQMRALAKVAEDIEVEVPEVMVDNAIDEQIRNLDFNLQSQGMGLEMYLQMMGTNIEDFKDTMREDAEREVRQGLALTAVKEAENIEVTDEEVEEEVQSMVEKYFADDKEKQEEMKQNVLATDRDAIANDLENRKALDFLVAEAVEVEAPEEEETEEKED